MMEKIPTDVVRCNPVLDKNACGLLQMRYSVPPEILYSAYWYRSGTNNTMRTHLRGIAVQAARYIDREEAAVLDIGCNDGTLLKNYPSSFIKFGVDPSDIAAEVVGDNLQVVQDVFPSARLLGLIGSRKLDIITSIAMFYDLEDPVTFCRTIKSLLAPEGVWCFEMSYMPEMLRLNSYDTICNEHLEYYSLTVLERITGAAGLNIFDVSFNDINGGSIRCFSTHADNARYNNPERRTNIEQVRASERDLNLDTDDPYRAFQRRIEEQRDELRSLLRRLKSEGKRIHVYGASTKGNTILQFCGIDHSVIDCAADRNPDKHGAKTHGTDIPIVSEIDSRAMHPDYYLVLPWHFKAEFLEREKAMLDSGVGFIFPLPDIEIVKR